MLDMIIRGGHVVTPSGVGVWDVAVSGEKIVAVAEPGALTDDVGRVVDASGKIVIPGGIEPHAHIAAPVALMAPPDQVSRAALFGGTTTLTDFAVQEPGMDIPGALAERASRWQGNSYSDYSHHCMLLGPTPTNVLGQIKEAVQDGFPTIKIFTTDVRPVFKMSEQERRLVGM
ncbi:MAG: amidohydrolase family protein, partial [Dehalococcoidia bacterium]|nr:amidohydrolase family protein [Dehalococcoidia bacterium]